MGISCLLLLLQHVRRVYSHGPQAGQEAGGAPHQGQEEAHATESERIEARQAIEPPLDRSRSWNDPGQTRPAWWRAAPDAHDSPRIPSSPSSNRRQADLASRRAWIPEMVTCM